MDNIPVIKLSFEGLVNHFSAEHIRGFLWS